mmetsp:Transcript_5793/g.22616  ORF Transcript_5793/g.22616 Transcript_5793/m.22616 type:complete len:310 (-) Transcript_5793:318-1247(-)
MALTTASCALEGKGSRLNTCESPRISVTIEMCAWTRRSTSKCIFCTSSHGPRERFPLANGHVFREARCRILRAKLWQQEVDEGAQKRRRRDARDRNVTAATAGSPKLRATIVQGRAAHIIRLPKKCPMRGKAPPARCASTHVFFLLYLLSFLRLLVSSVALVVGFRAVAPTGKHKNHFRTSMSRSSSSFIVRRSAFSVRRSAFGFHPSSLAVHRPLRFAQDDILNAQYSKKNDCPCRVKARLAVQSDAQWRRFRRLCLSSSCRVFMPCEMRNIFQPCQMLHSRPMKIGVVSSCRKPATRALYCWSLAVA